MLQAIVKKGTVIGEEIPAPQISKGEVLIKVVNSCISAGTEMSGVQISGNSIIKRAMNQPQNISKVINIVKEQGINKAYGKVMAELEGGKPTGYSISGIVIGVGEGINNFRIGDHVAAGGAGIANHAEYVSVPENLIVKMPLDMDFKEASTVTLGAIAMQGVRRANLKLGEFCVIVGSGILGLISAQLLRESGIRFAAIDMDDSRLNLAKEFGAELTINPKNENQLEAINNWTGGYGADVVLFTAATSSSEPLSASFQMCRKKGKVILVGVAGMNINRSDMYSKELDFKISTSYGPGRYDRNYEEKGIDYPYAYVRWTENRNMTEYLRLVKSKQIVLEKMIHKSYPIGEVTQAFQSLNCDGEKPLFVILDYGMPEPLEYNSYLTHDRKIIINHNFVKKDIVNVAIIGTGGFATGMHLPNIKKLNDKYSLHAVVDKTGSKAQNIAKQYDAKYSTTDVNDVLADQDIDLVLITTRHDTHADLVHKGLNSGKHVFVEKPLATNQDELNKIKDYFKDNLVGKPVLFVGFNRRFSKYALEIKTHTDMRINPLIINYRMNAGFIPFDHWVHEHGGRIVGECCHIIDLMTFLTNSKIMSISYESLNPANTKFSSQDNKSIVLKYNDGSICNIQYFAVGNKKFPKECMEIHWDGKTIVLDDYKLLKGFGEKIKVIKSKSQEKGHLEELVRLYDTLRGFNKEWPIELWDIIQTTEVSFLIK